MNGVHDMGGMMGFGPVIVEENEPKFHDEWERRVAAGLPTGVPDHEPPTEEVDR